MKTRVMILNEPEAIGGVTWWRMYRPLVLLERAYGSNLEIQWNRGGNVLPIDLLTVHVVIAFRPSEPGQLAVLQMAKKHGVRIIADYDDDLLNIPLFHSMYEALGLKAHITKGCIELADMLWVSTPTLAKALGHPNTVVIPNSVLPEEVPDDPNPLTKVAMWRGHWMHYSDLWHQESTYQDIMKRCSRFDWHGFLPPFQHDRDKVTFNVITDALTYFQTTRESGVNIVWKPLLDIPFNHSKSNIAWIESTCLGAVCLTNFAGRPTWEYGIPKLTFEQSKLHDTWARSRVEVRVNYSLLDANLIRYQTIQALAC